MPGPAAMTDPGESGESLKTVVLIFKELTVSNGRSRSEQARY